jgi:hypothetical protein
VIFRNRKGQVTGELLPDGVYEQHLNRRSHTFHSRGELAIDTAHLNSLKLLGAVRVRKIFRDTGETFEATLGSFAEHGYEKQWTPEDGPQTFLAEKYWGYHNATQGELF